MVLYMMNTGPWDEDGRALWVTKNSFAFWTDACMKATQGGIELKGWAAWDCLADADPNGKAIAKCVPSLLAAPSQW